MQDPIIAFLRLHKDSLAIALDADQVLAQTFERILQMQNQDYGTNYNYGDMLEYPKHGKSLMKEWTEPFDQVYDRLWNNDWRSVKPLADQKLLESLCTSFKVDVVSSRGEEAAQPLRDWLALNYPGLKANVIVIEKHSDKSALPYDLFIDDAPRLSQRIVSVPGKMVLLIDAPYNRAIPNSDQVVRIGNINEACKRLLEAKQKDL